VSFVLSCKGVSVHEMRFLGYQLYGHRFQGSVLLGHRFGRAFGGQSEGV
jgi:hypothetical protein